MDEEPACTASPAPPRSSGVPESKLRYWAQVGFVGPSVRRGRQAALLVPGPGERQGGQGAGRPRLQGGGDPQGDRGGARHPAARRPAARSDAGRLRRDQAGGGRRRERLRVDGPEAVRLRAGRAGAAVRRPALAAIAELAGADRRAAATKRQAYDWFVEGTRAELGGGDEGDARAERCYREALALDAGLAAARTNLGSLAYRRGDAAAAREAFEAALALDPDQPEARFNLANLVLENGDLELAVAELRRVLQTAPDFADAHYNLAVALERLGGRAAARAHLEHYLSLEPDATPWAEQARALIERLD